MLKVFYAAAIAFTLGSTAASAARVSSPVTVTVPGSGPAPTSIYGLPDNTPYYYSTSATTDLSVSIPTINFTTQTPSSASVSFDFLNIFAVAAIHTADDYFDANGYNVFSYTIKDPQSGKSISETSIDASPLPLSCIFCSGDYDSAETINVLSFDPTFFTEKNPTLEFDATSLSVLQTRSDGSTGTIVAIQPGTGCFCQFESKSSLDLTYTFYTKSAPAGPGAPSAAPEPSVWLLLTAGIGSMGLMLRRAKQNYGIIDLALAFRIAKLGTPI